MLNKEPVEKVKQNDKTQPPQNINQDDKRQQLLPSVNKEPVEKVKQNDKTQPPQNISQGDKRQQLLPANTSNPLQQLLNLFGHYTGDFLKKLSTSQLKSIIDQLGVTNLTLQRSQMRFLSCGGSRLLKQLKAKQLNRSLKQGKDFHHCKNMSFKSSGPSVALVSYPGSGNSWVRQLLESATGIYTGAKYCDMAYVRTGMIGEYIDTRNVLVIKVHSKPSTSLLGQYDKVIYIVRSPFGAILAEHNRILAAKNPGLHGSSHTAEINYKYGMYMYMHSYCSCYYDA